MTPWTGFGFFGAHQSAGHRRPEQVPLISCVTKEHRIFREAVGACLGCSLELCGVWYKTSFWTGFRVHGLADCRRAVVGAQPSSHNAETSPPSIPVVDVEEPQWLSGERLDFPGWPLMAFNPYDGPFRIPSVRSRRRTRSLLSQPCEHPTNVETTVASWERLIDRLTSLRTALAPHCS